MQNSSERPPRKPWLERGIFLLVILALGLWVAYDQLLGSPHTIVVDGEPVFTLESRQEAKSALAEVKSRQLGRKEIPSPTFAQEVSIRRAAGGAEIHTREAAVSGLDEKLVLKAQAYAIVVEEKPVTALAGEEDASRALDLLKRRYSERLKQLYSRPTFKERVAVDRHYLPVESIMATPEEAAEYLATVHEKPQYHTIERGDRAVRITKRYGISLQELTALNPGINIDRLTEGDRLLVRKPRPPVTVITKSLETKITPVKTPASPGMPAKTGKRQTWMVVTYENGHKVSEVATRVMTTWDKPAPAPTKTYRKSTSSSTRKTSSLAQSTAPKATGSGNSSAE